MHTANPVLEYTVVHAQCSNYRGYRTGGSTHCGCGMWTPCNTRRRSLGAFGSHFSASVSSPTAFFSQFDNCYYRLQ